jgi:hypothetical protein
MKRLHLLVFLGFLCVLTVNAQTDTDGRGIRMTQGQDKFLANLQLNTDLIELRHCPGDILRFTLRLNYTNMGKNAVILDKRSSVITEYMMSRSFKNATEKKYAIEAHRLIGFDGAGMTMDSVPNESDFVVLKPGEAYNLILVLTSNTDADSYNDGSRPLRGLNFLQLVVLTWYYPRASNIKWRDQWQAKGYLWSDPITSIPMPFKFDSKAHVVDCP